MQPLILKVWEHPTVGTFSWPRHSDCYYPADFLFSPCPLRVPQKPYILISFTFLPSASLGLPHWASWQGISTSKSGICPVEDVVWVLRNTFFPSHYRIIPKNYINKRQNSNSKRYSHPCVLGAQITMVKTWKQPNCSLVDKWIKMWCTHTHTHTHTHTLEYYSVIGKNEIMPFAATWMNPEITSHTKWSKSKTNITYM